MGGDLQPAADQEQQQQQQREEQPQEGAAQPPPQSQQQPPQEQHGERAASPKPAEAAAAAPAAAAAAAAAEPAPAAEPAAAPAAAVTQAPCLEAATEDEGSQGAEHGAAPAPAAAAQPAAPQRPPAAQAPAAARPQPVPTLSVPLIVPPLVSAQQRPVVAAPAPATVEVPPTEVLRGWRKWSLAELARQMGLSDDEDDELGGASEYLQWIERHRHRFPTSGSAAGLPPVPVLQIPSAGAAPPAPSPAAAAPGVTGPPALLPGDSATLPSRQPAPPQAQKRPRSPPRGSGQSAASPQRPGAAEAAPAFGAPPATVPAPPQRKPKAAAGNDEDSDDTSDGTDDKWDTGPLPALKGPTTPPDTWGAAAQRPGTPVSLGPGGVQITVTRDPSAGDGGWGIELDADGLRLRAVHPGSAAERAGLGNLVGMRLKTINNRRVQRLGDCQDQLATAADSLSLGLAPAPPPGMRPPGLVTASSSSPVPVIIPASQLGGAAEPGAAAPAAGAAAPASDEQLRLAREQLALAEAALAQARQGAGGGEQQPHPAAGGSATVSLRITPVGGGGGGGQSARGARGPAGKPGGDLHFDPDRGGYVPVTMSGVAKKPYLRHGVCAALQGDPWAVEKKGISFDSDDEDGRPLGGKGPGWQKDAPKPVTPDTKLAFDPNRERTTAPTAGFIKAASYAAGTMGGGGDDSSDEGAVHAPAPAARARHASGRGQLMVTPGGKQRFDPELDDPAFSEKMLATDLSVPKKLKRPRNMFGAGEPNPDDGPCGRSESSTDSDDESGNADKRGQQLVTVPQPSEGAVVEQPMGIVRQDGTVVHPVTGVPMISVARQVAARAIPENAQPALMSVCLLSDVERNAIIEHFSTRHPISARVKDELRRLDTQGLRAALAPLPHHPDKDFSVVVMARIKQEKERLRVEQIASAAANAEIGGKRVPLLNGCLIPVGPPQPGNVGRLKQGQIQKESLGDPLLLGGVISRDNDGGSGPGGHLCSAPIDGPLTQQLNRRLPDDDWRTLPQKRRDVPERVEAGEVRRIEYRHRRGSDDRRRSRDRDRDRDRRARPPPKPFLVCTCGRRPEPFTASSVWVCSRCDHRFNRGHKFHSCRRCDWDVCERCLVPEGARQAAAAAAIMLAGQALEALAEDWEARRGNRRPRHPWLVDAALPSARSVSPAAAAGGSLSPPRDAAAGVMVRVSPKKAPAAAPSRRSTSSSRSPSPRRTQELGPEAPDRTLPADAKTEAVGRELAPRLEPEPTPWRCVCGNFMGAHRNRCNSAGCGLRRPQLGLMMRIAQEAKETSGVARRTPTPPRDSPSPARIADRPVLRIAGRLSPRQRALSLSEGSRRRSRSGGDAKSKKEGKKEKKAKKEKKTAKKEKKKAKRDEGEGDGEGKEKGGADGEAAEEDGSNRRKEKKEGKEGKEGTEGKKGEESGGKKKKDGKEDAGKKKEGKDGGTKKKKDKETGGGEKGDGEPRGGKSGSKGDRRKKEAKRRSRSESSAKGPGKRRRRSL